MAKTQDSTSATVTPSKRDGKMHCVVVTPETTLVDEPADFVAVPLYDGELGIAPLHAPLIGRLGYGELRITSAGQTKVYYADGGFVQVVENVVTVLTNRAIPAGSIDLKVAQESLEAAGKKEAHTEELLELRERATLAARAQIRVANRSKAK